MLDGFSRWTLRKLLQLGTQRPVVVHGRLGFDAWRLADCRLLAFRRRFVARAGRPRGLLEWSTLGRILARRIGILFYQPQVAPIRRAVVAGHSWTNPVAEAVARLRAGRRVVVPLVPVALAAAGAVEP